MSEFDKREQSFENKFGHDSEQQFKTAARAARMLGMWVAEQMGLKDAEATAYATEVVESDLSKPGHDDLLNKIEKDITNRKLPITRHRLQREWEACLAKARG